MAKKVKKLRRKELLKDDEFLTSSRQFVNIIYDNRKLIFLSVAGFFAVVVLILAVSSLLQSGEKKAENLFAEALIKYNETLMNQPMVVQSDADEDPADRFIEAAEKFEEVVNEYSGKRVGVLSRYYAATCYYYAKDYDNSAKWYSAYLDKVGNDTEHGFVNLAYEGLGYAQEMNGKVDQALTAFESLINPDNKAFRERGLFNAARIYQVKNDDTKALELYKTLIEDYPDSMLAPQIKKTIAQLEMGT